MRCSAASNTINGGAGFLSLEPLVEICPQTEDIFNLLRQGDKAVTPELMDAVLQALDRVNAMFARLDSDEELDAVPIPLMEQLCLLNVPDESGVLPFAVPVDRLYAVVPWCAGIEPQPDQPDCCYGLLSYRGRAVWVMVRWRWFCRLTGVS